MDAGLPNITGSIDRGLCVISSRTATLGAFVRKYVSHNYAASGKGGAGCYLDFDASLSNPGIYGNSGTVTPLSQSTLYILKY